MSDRTRAIFSSCAPVVAFVLALSLFGSEARACSCVSMDEDERFDSADVVFWGTVDERTIDPNHERRYRAKFAVKRVFKGALVQAAVVTTNRAGTACGAGLAPGGSYLVYGHRRENGATVSTSSCSGTKPQLTEPIELGVDNLTEIDSRAERTERVLDAKRALRRLKSEATKKASHARRACTRRLSEPADDLGPLRRLTLEFQVQPDGDYFAVGGGTRTFGLLLEEQRRAIDRFVRCAVEKANEGDDFSSFSGQPLRVRQHISREEATTRWTSKQDVRAGLRTSLSTYFDILERVPSREAKSKLRFQILETTDVLASEPSPAYYGDDVFELVQNQYALGDCRGVFETIEAWPEYLEEDEYEEGLQRLRADCHMQLGEYQRALEVAEELAADETEELSEDTVRRDILRYAVEQDPGDGVSTKPRDVSRSFASFWLTDDGVGRLRRHNGIRQIFRLVEERRHHDTPLVLEALGDLLGRRDGEIPASHRRAAALAYLRAARSERSGQAAPEGAEKYRRLAALVLDGDDEEVAALEKELDTTLEEAREALRRRNRASEVVYERKLAELEALLASEEADDKAVAKTPAKTDHATPSDDRQPEDGQRAPDSAAGDEAGPDQLLLGAVALGLLALLLVGAAFLRDES